MTVTMYHSATAPNAGWWVVSEPTSPSGMAFVVTRVLKDVSMTEPDADIVKAARQAVPHLGGWAVVTDTPKRHFIGRQA